MNLLQIDVDGLGHRRGHRGRGIGLYRDACRKGSAQRAFTEYRYGGQVFGAELVDKGLDVRRRIERQQSVIRKLHVFEFRSHRACQDDGVYRQLELGKRLGQLGFVGLAQRQQEFLVLMFDYQFDE